MTFIMHKEWTFYINDTTYIQIDKVEMRSPLAFALAHFFMMELERTIVLTLTICRSSLKK